MIRLDNIGAQPVQSRQRRCARAPNDGNERGAREGEAPAGDAPLSKKRAGEVLASGGLIASRGDPRREHPLHRGERRVELRRGRADEAVLRLLQVDDTGRVPGGHQALRQHHEVVAVLLEAAVGVRDDLDDLHRPDVVLVQRLAVRFELAAQLSFLERLGCNVHGVVGLSGELIGQRTIGFLIGGDKTFIFRGGIFH